MSTAISFGVIDGFSSESQRDFFAEVLERSELSAEQVSEQYPTWPGWKILDRLLRNESESRLLEQQGRPASKRQVSYFTALVEQARVEGKDNLVRQGEALLESFSASMADFSKAIDVLTRHVTLINEDEAVAELDSALLGSEEPF